MSRSGDRGAAAVELALCLVVLLALAGLVLPVPAGLLAKTRLQDAANDTARWAASAPSSRRGLQRSLSEADKDAAVQAEAQVRYAATCGTAPTCVTGLTADTAPVTAAHCPLGTARTVTLRQTLDLGPLYRLAEFARPSTSTDFTITASATVCEE